MESDKNFNLHRIDMVCAFTNMTHVMNMAFVQQSINNNDNVSIQVQIIAKDHNEKIGNGETINDE